MMLQDKKIDKDDILKYCEITIDVVTGVFHWLMKKSGKMSIYCTVRTVTAHN